MGKINLLDKLTIDQIAAGEVIERPASVVKELVENAIDAGSNAVTIEITGGGIDLIRITDNGSGIEKSDVKTAFLRHATSKISTADDLVTVCTLGFRGEALASIASVAKVELITKTRSDFTGTRYIIEGGEEKLSEEIGCPDGTTFIVRDLFYNTPARKKFLKTTATEAGYISELVERIALSHPDVAIKYIYKGSTVIFTTGNNNLKEVIYGVYGRDIVSALVPAVSITGSISVDGFIGKPSISRGNRNYENYYVNGRYIKSSVITKAIEEAYKPYSMQHRFPFTALSIEVPTETLDVNVHPTKLEVRFAEAEQVYKAVYHAVSDALSGRNLIPDILFDDTKDRKSTASSNDSNEVNETKVIKEDKKEVKAVDNVLLPQNETLNERSAFYNAESRFPKAETSVFKKIKQPVCENVLKENTDITFADKPVSEVSINTSIEKKETEQNNIKSIENPAPVKAEQLTLSELPKEQSISVKPQYRIIGQVFLTYWLVECDNTFYIIDQHAAHEKIIYERLVKSFSNREVNSQSLMPPIVISLTIKEESTLLQRMDIFKEAGFAIENFGGREYLINAVPCELFGMCGEDYFKEILDQLNGFDDSDGRAVILEKLATMSCKAAIKGNSKVSETEARSLIEELLTLDNPFNCPHGRPIIVSMTKQELEKKFKRII